MKNTDLVFIGIRGTVVALLHRTGQEVWRRRLKGVGFVTVVMSDRLVLATCHGEAFALDPSTGEILWHNRLAGFGTGLATIACDASCGSKAGPAIAAEAALEQEQVASG